MDETSEPWIGVKRIEPGGAREPEQIPVPEPISRFEPIERRVDIAESRVDCGEGDRWGLAPRVKLLEFAEKAPGILCPAEPAIDMSQVGE